MLPLLNYFTVKKKFSPNIGFKKVLILEKYCESWSCHVPSVTCQEIPVHAHVKLYFRKLVCFLYLILLALKKQSTCDYHASFMMVPVYMVNFTNTSVCEIKFHWVKIFKLGIQLGAYLSLTRSGKTLRFPLHVPLVISIVIGLCLSTSLRKIFFIYIQGFGNSAFIWLQLKSQRMLWFIICSGLLVTQ